MVNNFKRTNQQRGFTIVELLIVIVVIGILAAITIVAYSGITARANTTKAITNSESVQKVAEAYNADPPAGASGYPATRAALTGYTGSAKIPSSITWGTPAATTTATQAQVEYVPGTTPANGGCIQYWNYTTSAINYNGVGIAVVNATATTCTSA